MYLVCRLLLEKKNTIAHNDTSSLQASAPRVRRVPRCTSILTLFLFINQPATTKIYTLSLHDALPISEKFGLDLVYFVPADVPPHKRGRNLTEFQHRFAMLALATAEDQRDRKSTRLNSSHRCISYAVFCLKKKIL